MLGYPKRPAPPTWKILLYCILALLIVCGLGWFNTHVLNDHTQYDASGAPIVSSDGSGSLASGPA